MRLTKITSSIGPASEKYDVLKQMIINGVNVCRFNFSHDTGDDQGVRIDRVRQIASELGHPVAVLCDMQGPKHRIGTFPSDGGFTLKAGDTFTLDHNAADGDQTRVFLPELEVLQSLSVGDRVLINDGKLELEVTETNKQDKVITRVIRGGPISGKKGFNLPDTMIAGSVLTEKDRRDLEYSLTKKPDFIAISFVQRPEDVIEVRDFITARTDHPVQIVVKVERPQAVADFDAIVDLADVIMVARGDLAVEMPFEQVPSVQRQMMRACRRKNKPIIIATQMLSSMVSSEFPMRAEVSDIATAAYLRTDACMTSEETTVSANPPKVVETMEKILSYTDTDTAANPSEWPRTENLPTNDWSRSVASMAYLNKASVIVVFDRDGERTRQISCRRPDMPIIAVCNAGVVANQLCLSRGVYPIFDERIFAQRDVVAAFDKCGIPAGRVVIVDGDEITLK